ncbi:MAG: lipocalin family protein [Sphaerochaetaceae bacterium]|nr:lipocalin family protein [Sphaerochaetaceae bacterium]
MKRSHQALIYSILIFTTISLSGCISSKSMGNPLDTIDSLDLERYLGRWYEVARYQKGFEKNIVGTTAEYSLREDGRVQVVNSGFKKTLDGSYTSVKAVAWRPDDAVPGALKVKFFGLFTSDYLVFGLDEDYQWALVGNNERDSLWFLSRTHELSEETIATMQSIATAQGYDLDKLYFVPQKKR